MPALGTNEAIAALHFVYAREYAISVTLVDEPVKFGDPSGSANKKLNSARITRYVRLFLFRCFSLLRLRTHWTGEHSFSIESCHRSSVGSSAILVEHGKTKEFRQNTWVFSDKNSGHGYAHPVVERPADYCADPT